MAERTPDEIRRDLEATRERMARTLDAISYKVNVPQRVRHRVSDTRGSVTDRISRVFHGGHPGNDHGSGSDPGSRPAARPSSLLTDEQRAKLRAEQVQQTIAGSSVDPRYQFAQPSPATTLEEKVETSQEHPSRKLEEAQSALSDFSGKASDTAHEQASVVRDKVSDVREDVRDKVSDVEDVVRDKATTVQDKFSAGAAQAKAQGKQAQGYASQHKALLGAAGLAVAMIGMGLLQRAARNARQQSQQSQQPMA